MRPNPRLVLPLLLMAVFAACFDANFAFPWQKPPKLDDSAENLVNTKQFDKAVKKANPVNPMQTHLHCEGGGDVDVTVYGVKHGQKVKLKSDFGSGHGRILAVVENPSATCTTKKIRLSPRSKGYWIVRHKSGQSDPESMIVVVDQNGIAGAPTPLRRIAKACDGENGVKDDLAQIRHRPLACDHRLDTLRRIQVDTLVHDPTLWMACSLTCCYADE
jgi:hypothetical protein